jgi:DNA primase catalytic core
VDLRDIKERVSLADLFGISTKQRQITCPFPAHKHGRGRSTPSLTINHATNVFNCWGCGAAGSPVDYFMHAEGLDLPSAIRRLADHAGVTLDPPTPEEQERMSREERRGKCLAIAAAYFVTQLQGEPHAYLLSRGFSEETLAELGIGYDDGRLGWFVQVNHADLLDDFLACGLIRVDEDGRHRDYFYKRIVFPFVAGGRVRHFSGRAMGAAMPKYKHMPARDGAGEDLPLGAGMEWLYLEDNLRRGTDVFAFEGQPDTITAHQWDIHAVGVPGARAFKTHAQKFRGKRVWLCFDNDTAGAEGLTIAAQMLDEAGAKGVYVLTPPEGFNDWNDWARAGGTAEQFRSMAAAAPTFVSAMITAIDPQALPDVKGSSLVPVWRILARRDPAERDGYIDLINKHLKVTRKAARDSINAELKRQQEAQAKAATQTETADAQIIFEDRTYLVPALDYHFNSPATAVTTVYVPTKRPVPLKDGSVIDDEVIDPYLVKVTIDGETRKTEFAPIRSLKLTAKELRRVPSLNTVSGRWRLNGRHPYSVENFVKGKAPAVDVVKLYDDIRGLFTRYIHLQDERDFDLLTCWAMQSYVYPLFHAVGYLWLHGPRESGKSTIAAFLTELCFNAKKADSMTESVMFRSVEANRCTVMIDEAERLKNTDKDPSAANLALIANGGYKRGGGAERNEPVPGGGWEVVTYDTYSPKVFASIEDLNFVLASRCIRITSETASAEEVVLLKDVAQNAHRLWPVYADLRDRLHVAALQNFDEINYAYTDVLLEADELRHLRGREREMWMPLLSIAALIDDRRFPEGTDVDEDLLVGVRLVELQKSKHTSLKAREKEVRLDLAVLAWTHEFITSEEIGVMRQGFDGKGDYYILQDLADLCTERAKETGMIAKDTGISPRRVKGFLIKLGAIDDLENDRPRDPADNKPKRVIQVDISRMSAAIERYGAIS